MSIARRAVWLLLCICLAVPSLVFAAVVISSFTALGGEGQILVRWQTASEIDVSGFYVQRSQTQGGPFDRISDFYVSMGDGVSGASYEHLDNGLTNGETYYYRLEVLNNNQIAEFYGPISAAAGVPTPTPTPTFTQTPTSTGEQPANNTSTPSTTATRTAAAEVSPTPTSLPAASATAGIGSTATPPRTPTINATTPSSLPGIATPTPAVQQSPVYPLETKGTPSSVTPDSLIFTPTSPAGENILTPGNPQTAQASPPIRETFIAPLDEESVGSAPIIGDWVVWIAAGLGGLMMGGVIGLVLWTITRKKKAG